MEFQLKGGILRLLFMKWGYVIILPIIRLSNSWLSDWKCERTLPTRLQQRAGFCFRHFSWWSLSPAATAFRWTHSLQCSGWVRGLRMYMNLSCSCVNCLCVRVILKWGQWAVVLVMWHALSVSEQETDSTPVVNNSKEPVDKEEALKAYHGLCESKK